MSEITRTAPTPELPVPAVGDRYVHRTEGHTVTVNSVWTAVDGHPAVAYEWGDRGQCGSACPLYVFHGTYQPEAAAVPATDKLPQQLRYLFGAGLYVQWADLPEDDRTYWTGQATAVRNAVARNGERPVLTDTERTVLAFALDLAGDRMASENGFTADDEAALASLRKLAGGVSE